MGISQTKRQQVIDNTISAGTQVNTTIRTIGDPCNIHGLILDLWIGSRLVTQHNFGQWAVLINPRGGTGTPSITTTSINAEQDNPLFWMLGSWMTVESDKSHVGGAPRTSRNCPTNSKLTLAIESSALSEGASRIHGTVTWFETQV